MILVGLLMVKKLIRVTEVLDYLTEPELLKWFMTKGKAFCDRSSKEALIIGTIIDQAIQDTVKLGKYTFNGYKEDLKIEEKIKNSLSAWDKFSTNPEKYGADPRFISCINMMQEELTDGDVVGHPDMDLDYGDLIEISDVKTSKMIYPKYWTQTAKYSDMKIKKYGITKPRSISILRLDKENAEPYYVRITDENVIQYELTVFEAYKLTYKHAFNMREVLRQQLEEELLCSTK